MAVVAVEHFDFDCGSNGSTHTLSSDVGATSKAFARLSTGRRTSAGPTGSTSNTNWDVFSGGVQLTDTAEVTGYRAGSNSATVKFLGEVWRYTGTPGGEHEFVVRAHQKVSITGSNLSASVAISGISNEDKVVPFITGQVVDLVDLDYGNEALCIAYMDGSGNLTVERNFSNGDTVDVYVSVVEFTGSAWSVGHGRANGSNASDPTVTLNTDSTGSGGSTFDVGDWATALIEATIQGDSSGANDNLEDTSFIASPGSSTTTVNIDMDPDGTQANDGDVMVHVIQNDALNVGRVKGLDTSTISNNGTYVIETWPSSFTLGGDLTEAALEWYVLTDGTGNAYARGAVGAILYDNSGTDAVRSWCHRSGNQGSWAYGVADLSGLVPSSTDATMTTVAGDATAAGGTGSLAGTADATLSSGLAPSSTLTPGATLTPSAGAAQATADGGSGSLNAGTSATMTGTVGAATASGGTGSLTGTANVSMNTTVGDAGASGGSGSLSGSATATTAAGSAIASGGVGSLDGTANATMSTTAGDAEASGGVGSLAGVEVVDGTLTGTAGYATAAGGVSQSSGTAVMVTLEATATASGGVALMAGTATWATLTGTAQASGGVGTLTGGTSATLTTLTGNITAGGNIASLSGDGAMVSLVGQATAGGGQGSLIPVDGAMVAATATATASGGVGLLDYWNPVTLRPDDGDTTRPGDGTTTRPSTGTTSLPDTGITYRPSEGVTARP